MRIHETTTPLAASEVMERARTFFASVRSPLHASPVQGSERHLVLHLDMGEIVLAAIPTETGTRVRGSASRGADLVTRFLITLPTTNEKRAGALRLPKAA